MTGYPDACPSCYPGDAPGAFPETAPEYVNGGTLAAYRCALCGTAWESWFDYWGWIVARKVASVIVPVDAGWPAAREAAA
jgi:hypothetical protein